MTKPAPVPVAKPTDLRAAFGFHAVPFTREIATDHHLRWPFLDQVLAGLLAAVGARMSAALTAPAGTGKTALLRRLHDGLPDALPRRARRRPRR
jgi:type II secretory pathway predicted ATPase ExeA